MKRLLLPLLALFCTACVPANRPDDLKTDGQRSPLATDSRQPRLTWTLPDGTGGPVMQTAYHVQASSAEDFRTPDLWDSGEVVSSETACIYEGRFPALGRPLFWRVRVRTSDGNESEWSQTACFENGLLAPQEWTGPWIGMDSTSRGHRAAYLRGTVRLDKPVVSARAYICAPGWYRLFVNGHDTSRGCVMGPAQTDYELRCLYMTEDIGGYLAGTRQQTIELGIILGDGWYDQWIAWGTGSMSYGQPRLRAQFVFNHPDGTQTSVPADLTWRAATGPIVENNVYRGEVYDARREIPRWGTNDCAEWLVVAEYPAPGPSTRLEPQCMPPERPVREVRAVSMKQITEPDGERPYMYDFGENLTGWCRLQLRNAAPGTRIRLEFAEKINPDGTLFRTPIGNEVNGTVQVDYYTAKGGAQETWEPVFTFHGFQYAALYVESGALPEAPSDKTLTAVVVHTDLPETASFDCSDPQLVRLHEAAGRTLLAGMHFRWTARCASAAAGSATDTLSPKPC